MQNNYKNIHFIGIGGAGMSAIAKVLLEMGYCVTGSDLKHSSVTTKLEAMGAKIFQGHSKTNVALADAVVVSSAISATNPEVVEAKAKNIPILHRADMVAKIMEGHLGITVAGAHGKTTTTSMIAVMLESAKVHPTMLIGGEVDYLGGNAKLGSGQHVVVEADESDGSFLKYYPYISVVTNIENDHMDYYKTMDNLLNTFVEYLHHTSELGKIVLCFENENIRKIAAELNRSYISYAIDQNADYQAKNIRVEGLNTKYDVYHLNQLLGTVSLGVPGKHNVLNSLAAVVVGLAVGLSFEAIAQGLAIFQGAKRRFQTKGQSNGIWVVDDYAHHPTEIKTTLEAALQLHPKRLICVFQPHRYSRTQLLRDEFGKAFKAADLLILTDIYSAGEQPIPGVNGELIKKAVEQYTQQDMTYIPKRENIAPYLATIVKSGDLVMTMGAGNIYLTGEELVESLEQKMSV